MLMRGSVFRPHRHQLVLVLRLTGTQTPGCSEELEPVYIQALHIHHFLYLKYENALYPALTKHINKYKYIYTLHIQESFIELQHLYM